MKKCSIILLKFNILFFFLNTFAKDGDLDPTFGTGGLVITDFASSDDFGNSIAIQPDGKIIVAGLTRVGPNRPNFALARYLSTPPTPDCPLPLPKGEISKLFIALRAKYGIFCPCNTQST